MSYLKIDNRYYDLPEHLYSFIMELIKRYQGQELYILIDKINDILYNWEDESGNTLEVDHKTRQRLDRQNNTMQIFRAPILEI